MLSFEKNYYRVSLLNLIDNTEGKPIMVKAIYKHKESGPWVTFSRVLPYVPGRQTRCICDHVNIKRDEIKRWISLGNEDHNHNFILFCYPYEYYVGKEKRGGLRLCTTLTINPIIRTGDVHKIEENIINQVFLLDHDEFINHDKEKKRKQRRNVWDTVRAVQLPDDIERYGAGVAEEKVTQRMIDEMVDVFSKGYEEYFPILLEKKRFTRQAVRKDLIVGLFEREECDCGILFQISVNQFKPKCLNMLLVDTDLSVLERIKQKVDVKQLCSNLLDSEEQENLLKAIAILEAFYPNCNWIDQIEKARREQIIVLVNDQHRFEQYIDYLYEEESIHEVIRFLVESYGKIKWNYLIDKYIRLVIQQKLSYADTVEFRKLAFESVKRGEEGYSFGVEQLGWFVERYQNLNQYDCFRELIQYLSIDCHDKKNRKVVIHPKNSVMQKAQGELLKKLCSIGLDCEQLVFLYMNTKIKSYYVLDEFLYYLIEWGEYRIDDLIQIISSYILKGILMNPNKRQIRPLSVATRNLIRYDVKETGENICEKNMEVSFRIIEYNKEKQSFISAILLCQ